MMFAVSLFDGFEDLSGTFSVADITLSIVLAFALSAIVAYTYRATHRGISYSQSYAQTLVILGMVVSVVMLIVGSNIARAFSLVGALSIVRFRNAVKETRDVGFIFLVMVIGMSTGTRFYTLAAVATLVICGVIVVMERFDWFKLDTTSQIVKVQVPVDRDYASEVDRILLQFTSRSDMVSAESIRGGALTELYYSVRLKRSVQPTQLIAALQQLTGGNRVTVLTGYDRTDL